MSLLLIIRLETPGSLWVFFSLIDKLASSSHTYPPSMFSYLVFFSNCTAITLLHFVQTVVMVHLPTLKPLLTPLGPAPLHSLNQGWPCSADAQGHFHICSYLTQSIHRPSRSLRFLEYFWNTLEVYITGSLSLFNIFFFFWLCIAPFSISAC